MIDRDIRAHTVFLTSALAIVVAFFPPSGAAMQGVELTGWTLDEGSRPSGAGAQVFQNFCDNNDRQDMENLYTQLEVTTMQILAEAGMGSMADYLPNGAQIDDILDGVEEACEPDDDDVTFGFTKIIYSQCRMFMDGETGQLDFLVPAGSDGHMVVFDGTEGARVNLTQRIQELSTQVGQGWSSDIQWVSGPGQTEERAGYPATYAAFEYTVGMGAGYGTALSASQQAAQGNMSEQEYLQQMEGAGLGQNQALQMISGMISNKMEGWGYFSTAAPGLDIVQSFYRNFAENVSPSGDLSSFFGGMINSQVGMLERGIPLEMHTSLETKVMGRTQMRGESSSNIHTVKLVNLPSDWCSKDLIPDNPNIRDIDAELEQALGSAGTGSANAAGQPSGGAGTQPGIQSVQQMMQQLSLGTGSNASADNPAAQAKSSSPAMPAASTRGSAAAAQPSYRLTTDNLNQTAQLHLQALGYPVGNTLGELDIDSVISISQFQAEKGLDVTGKVTPQLVGILSAEVDRRR